MKRSSGVALSGFAAALILSVPVRADTKAGVDAWSRGDFSAALREWHIEAERGDADALYNLGQAYRLGKGVPADLRQAESYYGRAASLGHLQAADNYGLLIFQRGEQARAMPYVIAAAARGEPRAQYLLGVAHFNGTLIAKDWPRAYALVSLAQQQGIGPATSALKQMDTFIPLEQRQQAVQLAVDIDAQAQATRARQLAAADLGASVPVGVIAQPTPRPVTIASADDAVTTARRIAGTESPATAGADYARPAVKSASVATVQPALSRPSEQPAVKPVLAKPAVSSVGAPGPTMPAGPSQAGGWRVQLGAFGISANADALWNRIKGRPELAGHPRINVRSGAVLKLQAGGFANQAAAKTACASLALAGTSCLPTSK
ncbi:SPOR domain-containing protein [Novosphingobium sp.]|uniref:SPOR domain-containing protein n=1 Tax=Novosphingobium sp. TaxID=1874826 RepID=UPI0025E3B377|nr:SPOR domain-containing protein [Novosphingobium sp.]